MFRKLLFAFLAVILATAGLVTIASGAGSWKPFQALDQGQENMSLSLIAQGFDPADVQIAYLQQQLDMVEDEIDDIEPPDIDPDEDEDMDDENDLEDDAYCDGTATSPHPVGTKLAELFSVTYEEIMDWHCQGWGFGEIAIAYTISQDSGIPVEDLFAMRMEDMGWGEILQEIGYMPGDYPKKLKFAPQPKKWCDGELPDPKVEQLAVKLGLTSEQVSQWLCDGVSIGAMHKAAKLAEETGMPLDEILAKRQSGMSWGEIMKEYNVIPGKPEKDDEPDDPDIQLQIEEHGKGNKFGLEKKGKSKP